MAVIQKKDEKAQSIFRTMKDASSIDEFKMLFKDMYANGWEKLWKEYKKEKAADKKNKGTPMPHPEKYLENMYKVAILKYQNESDVKSNGTN